MPALKISGRGIIVKYFKNSILAMVLVVQSTCASDHEASPASAQATPIHSAESATGMTGESSTSDWDIGYFFGYSLGNSLRANGVSDIDETTMMQGLKDALAGRASELDADQVRAVTEHIRALRAHAVSEANALRAEKLELEAEKSRLYLQANASQPGVKTTASGLQYIIENPGEGARPAADSVVEVTYRGSLTNGTEFDATEPGMTATFSLQYVIGGWSEGVPLIARGGKVRLFVPPKMGYGERGTPNIPPNAVLVFDVSLVDFQSSSQ